MSCIYCKTKVEKGEQTKNVLVECHEKCYISENSRRFEEKKLDIHRKRLTNRK